MEGFGCSTQIRTTFKYGIRIQEAQKRLLGFYNRLVDNSLCVCFLISVV
jgi:hypothetical protein